MGRVYTSDAIRAEVRQSIERRQEMSFLTEGLFHNRAAPAARPADPAALFAKISAAIGAFLVSLSRRKAIFELGRLDDRMLADMGLTRADLHEASRWSMWGDPSDRLAQVAEERRAKRG